LNYSIFLDPKDFATAAAAIVAGGQFDVILDGHVLYSAPMRLKAASMHTSGKMLVELEPVPAPAAVPEAPPELKLVSREVKTGPVGSV